MDAVYICVQNCYSQILQDPHGYGLNLPISPTGHHFYLSGEMIAKFADTFFWLSRQNYPLLTTLSLGSRKQNWRGTYYILRDP